MIEIKLKKKTSYPTDPENQLTELDHNRKTQPWTEPQKKTEREKSNRKSNPKNRPNRTKNQTKIKPNQPELGNPNISAAKVASETYVSTETEVKVAERLQKSRARLSSRPRHSNTFFLFLFFLQHEQTNENKIK